jgi:hypothetical protein
MTLCPRCGFCKRAGGPEGPSGSRIDAVVVLRCRRRAENVKQVERDEKVRCKVDV